MRGEAGTETDSSVFCHHTSCPQVGSSHIYVHIYEEGSLGQWKEHWTESLETGSLISEVYSL